MNPAVRAVSALKLDRLLYRLWRYNPSGLLRLYRHHAFDRSYGVETCGYGDLRYEPTPESAFSETIAALRREVDELSELVFVDIGSGKGKAVLLASTYPFRKVIGVELFEEFHRVARSNIDRFDASLCRAGEIELVQCDAAEYRLPSEPLVLFLFNPFAVEILERVLANVEAAIESHPARRLYVLFYAPIVFRGTPWDRRRVFDESPKLRIAFASRRFTLYCAASAEAD